MPLYYLADATLTLVWRIAKGRPVAQAHRDHFYQRAIDGGRGIYRVIGPVFAVNIVLVALAASSVNSSTAYQLLLIALGLAIVGALLWSLADPKRSKQ